MLEHSRAAGGSGGGVELLSNGSGLQHWESFNIAFMIWQPNRMALPVRFLWYGCYTALLVFGDKCQTPGINSMLSGFQTLELTN